MLSQNPSPLTLLSFLPTPFLSRSPSPSAQSAEIVELPETTQEQKKKKRVAEEIPDTKHACWPPDICSQHVTLYTNNKIPLLKLIFVLLIYYLKYYNSSTYITIPLGKA